MRSLIDRLSASLHRFMYGRNGMDQLNMALVAVYLLIYLILLFVDWLILDILSLALVVVILFRALSRQLNKRQGENAAFLRAARPIKNRLVSRHTRMQDREHCYFRCPCCGQQMRAPKGKGRITVHCRTCGTSFEQKS